MRTRRSYFLPTSTIPRRSRKQTTNVAEPEFCTIVEMADNRTMAQMLQAPIEGYEDAIVVPQINANNFELKQTLINLVQSNQFMSRQDPHNHLGFFNKVTSTFRHPEVPNTISYQNNEFQPSNDGVKKVDEDLRKENECNDQGEEDSTNRVNIVTSNTNVASSSKVNDVGTNISIDLPPNPNMPSLEDIGIFEDSHNDEDVFEEEVYVCQPPGFEDLDFPDKVYKVEKALYGLHQALRACQDKYVAEILKKFGFSDVKKASTPMETLKPLLKDEDGEEVDVYMYRSMIGSLMYLTLSRLDIMFVVCACARYQVTPKVSHLHDVTRIFRYLKGQPKLGLWYLKDSLFDLVAYTDSDYAGASLDKKSTTGGCQFLGCRLISW
nr:uncharacterized mitochondrial protein AtMg00810-like [Tanacetum cinerariifolium]